MVAMGGESKWILYCWKCDLQIVLVGLFCRLNKKSAMITPEDREKTKRIVYAMMYGAGAGKLAEILEVTGDEAHYIINSFNS